MELWNSLCLFIVIVIVVKQKRNTMCCSVQAYADFRKSIVIMQEDPSKQQRMEYYFCLISILNNDWFQLLCRTTIVQQRFVDVQHRTAVRWRGRCWWSKHDVTSFNFVDKRHYCSTWTCRRWVKEVESLFVIVVCYCDAVRLCITVHNSDVNSDDGRFGDNERRLASTTTHIVKAYDQVISLLFFRDRFNIFIKLSNIKASTIIKSCTIVKKE